ncbi:MAG TPA: sigma 54-interacting transcriptional regulator, partial [Desulfomonilia bacterium]|nr:sigma 54-interacting transcriptional regulator [Desulfomonilia bacterium]
DLKGRITFFNSALTRILGYSKGELIGKSYRDLRGSKDAREIVAIFNSVYRSGKPLESEELPVLKKDGSKRIIQLSITLMRDASGAPVGFRGIVRDMTDIRESQLEVLHLKDHLEKLVSKRTEKLRKANRLLKKEIEDRKHAEENLLREKKFTEDIIEAIPSVFYVYDESGKFLKWNKNIERISGYSSEELYNSNLMDHIEVSDQNNIAEKTREVFQTGRTSGYATVVTKDRRRIPYFFTGLKTNINNKDYLVGVGIDLADLEEAKKALHESEERLSLAAASADAGLWSLDIQTGRILVTQKALELHGVAPETELTFEGLLNIIHPEDRDNVGQAVQNAMQLADMARIEYRIILSDGRIRWLFSLGRPHSGTSGESDRLMGVSIDITDRKFMEEQLRDRLQEIERLKEQLEKENIYLREEVSLLFEHGDIVGESKAIRRVLSSVEDVAPTDSTVLILGETGTGKELLARAIHNMSKRSERPLITVNCASLPPSLIESELFGREKGAFTGAMTRMAGRFETADGSSLFLDEIGELPYDLQSKLLRVLETGTFERLGSTKTIRVNVRLIAATNRDLTAAVKEGKFRKDLFYRLNVFPIVIPPLRERTEDIPDLIWVFVRQYEKELGKRIEGISQKSMEALIRYPWPGNIRELKNVIERAMIVSKKTLDVLLPDSSAQDEPAENNLKDMERRHILSVLKSTGWRIAGKGGAAEKLGLKRTTLNNKMKALGISRQEN